MKRSKQRGFTLVEMMISLLISTLLVIMILSIFARMSFSYREQQQVVSLQQSLAAARQAFEQDAKQAGLMLAQGFNIAKPGNPGGTNAGLNQRYPGVQVINSSTGPDQVAFYYADTSNQAVVTAGTFVTSPLTLDSKDNFAVGDVVLLSTADTTSYESPVSKDDAPIAKFAACVVQIATLTGTAPATVTFRTSGTWGTPANAHCSSAVPYLTMMYKFVAHGWRIDTTRPDLAPLQQSATGLLFTTNVFTDQAYGFTDLQIATYMFDQNVVTPSVLAGDTPDPDSDGARDWYSSTEQTVYTAPHASPFVSGPPAPVAIPIPVPLAMTISLVNRTAAGIEGITTAATPMLTEPGNTSNNPTGDRASVALPSATDPMLMGNRIYRYITFQVDLRNMGVGL